MELVWVPSMDAARRVAQEGQDVVFRYGSSKNSVVATPGGCKAIVEAHDALKAGDPEKTRIFRMVARSAHDFSKLLERYANVEPAPAPTQMSRRRLEDLKNWRGAAL